MPSPKEQASARWHAANELAQHHIWPSINAMQKGEASLGTLSELNEAFRTYTTLCAERLDDVRDGETILRYAPFKDDRELREKLEELGDTLTKNQRFYQEAIQKSERQENGETVEYHRVITQPSESALTDMQGNPIKVDEIHALLPNHTKGFAAKVSAERAAAPCVKLHLSDNAFAALLELKQGKNGNEIFGNEALEAKVAAHNKGRLADADDRLPTLREAQGPDTVGQIIGGLDKPFDSVGLAA